MAEGLVASFKVKVLNVVLNLFVFISTFFSFFPFFHSPDATPIDFSVWNQVVRAVCNTVPQNRTELVTRLLNKWHKVLTPNYVTKTCSAAWDRLRCVVDENGGYLKPMETVVDENNNE